MRQGNEDGPSRTARPGRKQVIRLRTKSLSASTSLRQLKVERILVPVDFSDAASQAVDYAVALAAAMRAKIILLHVIEPVYVNSEPALNFVPQLTEVENSADGKKVLAIARRLIPKNLFDKAELRLGTPYHEITEAARTLKAGLIVLTTHGRTGLSHVLMGSTAERVVRHASCPVLTVRRSGRS